MSGRLMLCKVFGHRCSTIQSDQIASFVGGGTEDSPQHWCWPGVITFCPRCGFVWASQQKPVSPWFTRREAVTGYVAGPPSSPHTPVWQTTDGLAKVTIGVNCGSWEMADKVAKALTAYENRETP